MCGHKAEMGTLMTAGRADDVLTEWGVDVTDATP